MPASADTYSKAWYGRQLDRLHREAPADKKTTPEDALRHLPIECLAEVLDTTFKNYDTRASVFAERCLVEGDMDTYHAFIKAHHNILEQFDIPAPNHYRDMARIIGNHYIRQAERRNGITRTTIVKVSSPKMPNSPLSSSPTPPSVLSWINKVEDSTSEPPPFLEEGLPELTANTPEGSFSRAPISSAPREPESTESTSPPQRQRHPRKAKTESVSQGPVESLPAQKNQATSNGAGRDRRAAKKEPTSSTIIKKDANKQPNGTKRQRPGDAMVLSEHSQVIQKRRKITKPSAKSKR
jgi:hypothetical protein